MCVNVGRESPQGTLLIRSRPSLSQILEVDRILIGSPAFRIENVWQFTLSTDPSVRRRVEEVAADIVAVGVLQDYLEAVISGGVGDGAVGAFAFLVLADLDVAVAGGVATVKRKGGAGGEGRWIAGNERGLGCE